jgi:hypothetical protein
VMPCEGKAQSVTAERGGERLIVGGFVVAFEATARRRRTLPSPSAGAFRREGRER